MSSSSPKRVVVLGSVDAEDVTFPPAPLHDEMIVPPYSGVADLMAGPQAHRAKLAFERDFLASRKRGLTAF